MSLNDRQNHSGLLSRWGIPESDNPGVGTALQYGKFPKVLITGNNHPTFPECVVEDGLVARVLWPNIFHPNNVMARLRQVRNHSTPRGRVDEQTHYATPVSSFDPFGLIMSGSNLSRPASLLAYSRQA